MESSNAAKNMNNHENDKVTVAEVYEVMKTVTGCFKQIEPHIDKIHVLLPMLNQFDKGCNVADLLSPDRMFRKGCDSKTGETDDDRTGEVDNLTTGPVDNPSDNIKDENKDSTKKKKKKRPKKKKKDGHKDDCSKKDADENCVKQDATQLENEIGEQVTVQDASMNTSMEDVTEQLNKEQEERYLKLSEQLKMSEDKVEEHENKQSDLVSNIQSLKDQMAQLEQSTEEKEKEHLKTVEKLKKDQEKRLEEFETTKKLFQEKIRSNAKEIQKCKEEIIANERKIKGHKLTEKTSNERFDSQRKELEQYQCENSQIRKDNEKLLDKLSEVMNNKLNKNESDIENINMRNRPLKLKDDYELFCSNTWLQTKVILDDSSDGTFFPMKEQKKHEFLVDIMMDAGKAAEKAVNLQRRNLQECLNNPFGFQNVNVTEPMTTVDPEDSSIGNNAVPECLTDELNSAVTKHLKMKADSIDFENVSKLIVEEKVRPLSDTVVKDKEQLQRHLELFTAEICKLCWKMAIQKPPMWFSASDVGQPFNDDAHELQFGSADPKSRDVVIRYYAHPALMHGSTLVKRGKVMLQ